MLRIALCDDDKRYIKVLNNIISEYFEKHNMEIEIECHEDGEELIEAKKQFDIIFLDIEMERMNGLEAAMEIRRYDMNVPIVYVTNHSDYWRRAYQVHAFQFILKPIRVSEVNQLLDDFCTFMHDEKQKQIRLITDDGMVSIRVNDIYYFYIIKKKQVMLHTANSKYLIKENLSDVYEKLEKSQFYMPHRCCIVNLRYVDNVVNNYDIIMKNGDFLPLAHKKKEEFWDMLSERFIIDFKGGIG